MANKRIKYSTFLILLVCILIPISIYYKKHLPHQASSRPDVILISIDALRPEHLSCYGYPRLTSPHIDELARKGVLFTNAISQSSHTPPCLGSILTSLYQHEHLLHIWGAELNPRALTLTAVLKLNNYKTIFLSSNNDFSKNLTAFTRGFNIVNTGIENVSKIIDSASDYISSSSSSQPIFLWIHLMTVHRPRKCGDYCNLFINDKLYDPQKKLPIVEDAPDSYGYNGIPSSLVLENKNNNTNIDNPDYYIAQYDASIRNVDEKIGILLDKLVQDSFTKNSIIIITADHGEMFGEHGYYFHHGRFLFEPLIKIPLILYYPGVFKHRVVSVPVSGNIDIMPTLLDILKIPNKNPMKGASLLPLIKGSNRYPHKYLFSEVESHCRSVRTEEWKLISDAHGSRSEEYQLYNLKKDPNELNNLILKEKNRANFLKQILKYFIKDVNYKIYAPKPLDEETRRKLKSLGYIQ